MQTAPLRFPDSWADTKTALCHDWLTGMRGGEKCLEIFCQGFPDATIHTLLANPDSVSDTIRRHPRATSFLNKFPGIEKRYRNFLPLFPRAIGRMAPPPADTRLLLSSSHCVAKSLRTHPDTKHLCYCFTPMRYAWLFPEEYLGWKAKPAAPLLRRLRDWDARTADRVDRFIAISHHVRARIETFYKREADVVYPPVDVHRFVPAADPSLPRDYDLIVSALVPYKRVDLAVRAYNRLGFPLKVAGSGGQFNHLKAIASPNVEILGWTPDDDILRLVQGCRHLIFPGEEDFGIVPLEAMACGRPVVALARGGALETVVEDQTGVYFPEQTEASLLDAIDRAAARNWDESAIRRHAETFGPQRFVDEIAAIVANILV